MFIVVYNPAESVKAGVNKGWAAYITCSNGVFVLMPFPPTKIQLSLKPRVLITELPRSEIKRRASSLSLRNRGRPTWTAGHVSNNAGHVTGNRKQCGRGKRGNTLSMDRKKVLCCWIIERSHHHYRPILDFLQEFDERDHICATINSVMHVCSKTF